MKNVFNTSETLAVVQLINYVYSKVHDNYYAW